MFSQQLHSDAYSLYKPQLYKCTEVKFPQIKPKFVRVCYVM